jgi:uncharacterized protein (TIGR02246 family)
MTPSTRPVVSIRAAFGLACALALTAACAPAPPPDTRAADEAAIRTADQALSAAAKDLDRFMAAWTADGVMMPPNQPMASGTAAVRTTFGAMLAAPNLNVSWTPTTVDVARSGDLGYSIGTYSLTMDGPDGKPIADHGKYTTIWKKQTDGTWKVAADIFNSDVPLPAPPSPPAKH